MKKSLSSVLAAEQIKRYYHALEEPSLKWPGLWMKQYKIVTHRGIFVSLNKDRPRLSFPALKRFCQKYSPVHLYMSVLGWLMPERVGSKKESIRAYPVGGEYVLDLDSYLCYTPHGHRTELEGFCYGCLAQAKELTEKLLRARMYSIIYDHSVINTNDNICENC